MRVAIGLPGLRRRAFLVVLSLGLAVWGQWAAFTQHLAVDAATLFGFSLLLFSAYVLRDQAGIIRAGESPLGSQGEGTVPVARAGRYILVWLGAAALAWAFSGGNRFRPETTAFWLISTAFLMLAFWQRGDASSPSQPGRWWLSAGRGITLSWEVICLLAVLIVAAFFRYYQIAAIPAEMTSDHAEKLLDVRDILNGQRPIFFPRNTGREPLQFYLAAILSNWTGLTHLTLKLVTATASLLTVPVVFLIGRDLVGARYGLLAAFFLAVSKWDVGIGRVGLRAPFAPLFGALCLYFLLRALRYGRRNDYLLCGLVTGVGLYGYSPFRAVLLLIPAALLVKLVFERRSGWPNALNALRNTALCLGVAATVMIPLGHFMVERPQDFWMRALSRVLGPDASSSSSPLGTLLSNTVNAMLMFNWRGDSVWVNTFPYDPVLDWASGGLFLLGIGWCIFSLARDREPVAAYLLLALGVFLLPSIISVSFPLENPSVFRAGGATPVVALLTAAPLYLGGKRVLDLWPGGGGRWLAAVSVAAIMALTVRANYDRYFYDYAAQYKQSARNSSEIASVILGFDRSVGSRQNAYIKSWPHWVDTRNVAINMGTPEWNNVLITSDDLARHPAPQGNKLYVLNKDDADGVRSLQRRYPQGQLREQPSAVSGQQFLLFFVSG